ncbi:ABC transporter ATP-binding protein [Eggerthia catenaformis]
MKVLKKYLRKNLIYFLICILIFSMAGIMSVFLAYISKMIIDTSTLKNISMFRKTVILAVAFIVLNFIIYVLRGYFKSKYLKNIMFQVNHDLFETLIRRNITSFNRENSSVYVSAFNNDLKLLEKNYFDNLLTIISDLSQFIICLIAIFTFQFYLAIIIVIINIIAVFIPFFYGKYLSKKQLISSKKFSDLNVRIKDFFNSFEIIKCFQVQDKVINKFDDLELKYELSMQNFRIFEGIISGFSTLSSIGVSIVTMLISLYFVINNKITIGEMMAIVQLVNNVANPLGRISNEIPLLRSTKEIEEKINHMLSFKNSDSGIYDLKDLNTILLKKVSFSYDGEKDILHNISFEFKKGKKYAIVGSSGSGKTTLVKLVLKYFNNYHGDILLNNVDIRKIKINEIYNNISIVHQNAPILNDTLKNNILYYGSYDDNIINDVIIKSGLQELVNKLPKGLDTLINENGNNISGGEKQRISIARVLLRDTPFIIYDEPTSNLDSITSQEIDKILLSNNKGCLMITHKLNEELLKQFDYILVLENGFLKEYGNYNELINSKKYFYKLLSYKKRKSSN